MKMLPCGFAAFFFWSFGQAYGFQCDYQNNIYLIFISRAKQRLIAIVLIR